MNKTIVCFGDSNTHGYDNMTGGRFDTNTRWPRVLQKLLGEDYLVIEEGLSGRTTCFEDPLNEGLNSVPAIHPVLMTHEPVSLLIIMLGTNDTKERFGATAANIAKGMERLVKKAKASIDAWANGPKILIVAPPPILPEYAGTDIGDYMGKHCDEKSRELPPLLEQVAELFGCEYMNAADTEGVVMGGADFMHLTPAAHQALAQVLCEKIRGLFKTGG